MAHHPSSLRPVDDSARERIDRIVDQFAIEGRVVLGEEIESGLINTSYRVTLENEDGRRRRFLLQRINEVVFRDPVAVMRNVECVTRHINDKVLRVKRDLGGQTLTLCPARDGRSWVDGANGGVWRCYHYIEGCHTYDIVETPRQAYQAAHAFGAFQDLVRDLPATELVETIPGFHDTPRRFRRLMEVASADPHGRAGEVGHELEFIRHREPDVGRLDEMLATGAIPRRIVHNDTKINNVMIDQETDEAVCVIDLDTVMPGSVLHDFGDLVRTAVSPAAEDEPDLSKVEVRMPVFEALVEGYLDSAVGLLTPAELGQLAFSSKLISLELAIRFLTDHLEGDVYFKIHRPGQNLDRCRAQLALVERLEEKLPEMEAFVRRAVKERGR